MVEVPLQEAFDRSLSLGKYERISTKLALDISSDQLAWMESSFDGALVATDLKGPAALLNRNLSHALGEFPLAVDLILSPFIAIASKDQEVHLFSVGRHGELWHKVFTSQSINSIIAYDDGYGGYALQTSIPLPHPNRGRKEREEAQLLLLAQELQKGKDREFSPPLQMFFEACKLSQIDFVGPCLSFLKLWNTKGLWIYPVDAPLPEDLKIVFRNLHWLDPTHFQGAMLAHSIFSEIESELHLGKNLLSILKQMRWPLLDQLKEAGQLVFDAEEAAAAMTQMTQQIFSAAELLPNKTIEPVTPEMQASLFSLFLRAFQIHLQTLLPLGIFEQAPSDEFTLETAIFPIHEELPIQKKLEENVPAITLRLVKGRHAETVVLSFDRTGKGLKWPAWQGEYLLRLQPQLLEIPYQVRLRSARRQNYPNSTKPFSFESDLIITDRRTGEVLEKKDQHESRA